MKRELGGFQLRGVRKEDEWGRKVQGGTSRMHHLTHSCIKTFHTQSTALQSRTEAKFKLSLIVSRLPKKGGVISLYYTSIFGPVASHRVGQC